MPGEVTRHSPANTEPRAQTVQTFQHQMLQPTRDFAQNISNLSFIVIAKYKLPEKPRIIAINSA